MKLKKIAPIVLIFLILFSAPVNATDTQSGEININQIIDDQITDLNLDEISNAINSASSDLNMVKDFNFTQMVRKVIAGDIDFNIASIFKSVVSVFLREILFNFKIIGQILILSIICAVLHLLETSFNNSTISKASFYICLCLIITLAAQSLVSALSTGGNVIRDLVNFMHGLLPTLFMLMASMGNLTSSSVMQPIILLIVTAIGNIINVYIRPLIMAIAAVGVLDTLSANIRVDKLHKLMRSVVIFVLGLIITIFTGIITIQGIAGSVVDGVALRGFKFAAKNVVPILGGMFADSVDAIIGCGLLVKSAIGIVGLIAILIICLVPIVKLISILFVFKLSAAIIEPISDERLVKLLTGIADAIMLITLCVACVTIMFFITITVLVGISNMTVMLR